MKKRDGFTLIELMMVLAIIAILSVVIIPKAVIFKKSAKESGITANMITLKAFLEAKADDKAINSIASLENLLNNNFVIGKSKEDKIINPMSNNEENCEVIAYDLDADYSKASVIIFSDILDAGDIKYKGCVCVSVNDKQFTVQGVDFSGNLLNTFYVINR